MAHKNKFLLALLIISIFFSFLFLKQKNRYLKERNQARSALAKNQTEDPNYLKDKEIYELLFNKSSQIDFNSPNYEEKNSIVKSEINVSQQMLDNAQENSNDWIHTNGNYNQNRYYKNTTININNVKKLKLAFTLATGVKAQIESTPIAVNGIVYISTSFNNIYAFDGKTGFLIWHYKYQNTLGDYFPYNCCGPNNRGLAIFKDKLFMGTLDGNLVCVDAKDGKLIWKKSLAKPGNGYSITAAPVVVNNKVIIGIGDGDFGVKGFLNAYNYATGELIWSFNTIPDKGQEGVWATTNVLGENLNRNIEKEKEDLKRLDIKKLGGAGVWASPSVDIKNNLVIFCAGNNGLNLNLEERPGDNLFTNSIIAIDLNTGLYKWHYQYFPHEQRNIDPASPTVLFEYNYKGKKIPAVLHAGKSGNIFIHDRLTGKLLAITEHMVPQKISDDGGVTWSPVSYSPKLNYVYSINKSFDNNQKTTGRVVATNLSSTRNEWVYNGHLINGGILSTASNLIFFGEDDGNINALNAQTGQKLWTYKCDAGANGVPSAYAISGIEYVIIGCGGNRNAKSPRGNKFYAFKLK